MKNGAYYFSHDLNARNDPKILILRSVYGMEGYGRYWVLIEMLREQSDFKIMLSPHIWNALALQMQCKADAVKEFVEFCINDACLLASDGKAFWSPSLVRRMGAIGNAKNVKSERAKKAAEARWGKASKAANEDAKRAESMHKQCISNADASCKDANKIKRNEIKDISTTTTEEQSKDIAKVFTAYENNIHPIAGEIETDKLHDLLERYGPIWLIAAIERSVTRNKRSIGYIEGILQNWETNGLDGGNGDGEHSGSNKGNNRSRKENAARKETDWEREPDGLPPI